ncbi:hypothetical protein D3C75_927470 [compost metagenome]
MREEVQLDILKALSDEFVREPVDSQDAARMCRINSQTAVHIRQNLAFAVPQKDIRVRVFAVCTFNCFAELGGAAPEGKRRPVGAGLMAVVPHHIQRIRHFIWCQLVPESIEVDVQRILVMESERLHFLFQEITG